MVHVLCSITLDLYYIYMYTLGPLTRFFMVKTMPQYIRRLLFVVHSNSEFSICNTPMSKKKNIYCLSSVRPSVHPSERYYRSIFLRN